MSEQPAFALQKRHTAYLDSNITDASIAAAKGLDPDNNVTDRMIVERILGYHLEVGNDQKRAQHLRVAQQFIQDELASVEQKVRETQDEYVPPPGLINAEKSSESDY